MNDIVMPEVLMNFALSTWISLHTDMPDDRNEHEVSYTGYQRQYAPMHGSGVADVTFPMYTDAGQCVVTHAGMRATRNGPLMMSVRLLPHVWRTRRRPRSARCSACRRSACSRRRRSSSSSRRPACA